jgi:UDP-N-acetylmuramoylalanine--D-glutamate ligase
MTSKRYKGKKVLVVGLGLSGRAASGFLIEHGASVQGVDKNIGLLQSHPDLLTLQQRGLIVQHDSTLQSVKEFDFIVVSPGVPHTHPLYQRAKEQEVEILGEIELGCRSVSNPVIGVTGTNGKTTTTLLIAHVLNACGKKARALGNVGVPLTQEISSLEPDEILVLELSSYQLETLRQQVLDAAVLLNITPDHLERYGTMEAYAKAKFSICSNLKKGAPFYIEEKAYCEFGHLLENRFAKRYGYSSQADLFTDLQWIYNSQGKIGAVPEAYSGRASHDLENQMATYAICEAFGIAFPQFIDALSTFTKPAHRIQFICEKKGVSYYDDSKGTNIDAVIRAVQSLKGPVILIAGGVDKGAPYTAWIQPFMGRVKGIYAIGQAAQKIQEQLAAHFPVSICESLEQAVGQAAERAEKGDHVLLSPGCASFDMFRDYAHRGEEFQRIVGQL